MRFPTTSKAVFNERSLIEPLRPDSPLIQLLPFESAVSRVQLHKDADFQAEITRKTASSLSSDFSSTKPPLSY